MSPERRRQVGRTGGLAAAKSAKRNPRRRRKVHRWTRAEAARAAKKGHRKSPGPRNPHGVRGSRKKKA